MEMPSFKWCESMSNPQIVAPSIWKPSMKAMFMMQINKNLMRSKDGMINHSSEKILCFETFACKSAYDPDVAANYPTLFDYWVSEVYVYPPILTGLDADYILINLAVERLSDENVIPMYTMTQNGGDETKAFWFMKIADLRVLDYYNPEINELY